MRVKSFKPYVGQITTARQLIRHRNILLGLPIRRIPHAGIPYGYETDPDKEGWLRPVQKQLEALYYARKFQHRSTYKGLCEWLFNETGRYLSPASLRIIFRTRPPLSAYLLDLNDRFSIATAETEDKAIELANYKAEWGRKDDKANRERHNQQRAAYTEAKEKAREAKEHSLRERASNNRADLIGKFAPKGAREGYRSPDYIPPESGATDGVPSGE